MKSIYTLVPDIQELVTQRGWFHDKLALDLSTNIGLRLQAQFGETPREPTLRLSQMGKRCPKALWHSIHTPELADALPPWAEIKYSLGHVVEAYAIALAKAAGHTVTGEQDELVVDGIKGHRDCVIDGCVVDVKSSSSMGFLKFKHGTIKDNDDFGYLDQLDGYVLGSRLDELVHMKDRGYLLAIDKTLGHMCLYEHKVTSDRDHGIRDRIRQYKEIIGSVLPPACTCKSVPDGKSGNYRLDVKASYNPYKFCCFPQLRTFLYASGPVYLTHVARLPDVPELK